MPCVRLLSALLGLLLVGCRLTPSPLETPPPNSTASPPEPATIRLPYGLAELVRRWDSPSGTMPDQPEDVTASEGEFQNRFHRFCLDVGILAAGEPSLPLEDTIYGHRVQVLPGTPAHMRLQELCRLLAPMVEPRQATVDLLVLDVPGKLARGWGLDGLPAAGEPPPLLKDGIPESMGDETFAEFRSLLLDQPGTSILAVASAVARPGETAVVRQAPAIPAPEPEAPDNEDENPLETPPSLAASEPGLLFAVTPGKAQADGWASNVEVRLEIADGKTAGQTQPDSSPSLVLRTRTDCTMGQTTFLGSMAGQTGHSCRLVFLTLRWLEPMPSLLAFADCGPQGYQFLAFRFTWLIDILYPRRHSRPRIDWGDEDESEEDADEKAREQVTAGTHQFLQNFGIDFSQSGKLIPILVGPGQSFDESETVVVCFGPFEKAIRRVDRLFAEIMKLDHSATFCHVTTLQVSPEKWVELTGENAPDRQLSREEVRNLLDGSGQNESPVVLATSSVSVRSLGTVSIHNPNGQTVTVRRLLRELAGLVSLGIQADYAGSGHPANTIETQATLKCGHYALLGGGGGNSGSPVVLWLVGVE